MTSGLHMHGHTHTSIHSHMYAQGNAHMKPTLFITLPTYFCTCSWNGECSSGALAWRTVRAIDPVQCFLSLPGHITTVWLWGSMTLTDVVLLTLLWEPAHTHAAQLCAQKRPNWDFPLERRHLFLPVCFFRSFEQDIVYFCINRNKSQNLQSRSRAANVRRGHRGEGMEKPLWNHTQCSCAGCG